LLALAARLEPVAHFLQRGGFGIALRLGLGVLAAALIVLIGGPQRRIAQWRGWRLGESLPPLLHRALCHALGVRLRVHGEPAAAGPQLVVANHVSWLDIVVLGAMRPTEFLAKKEVGDGFFTRHLVALQGAVYIDRARKRKIPAANAAMARRMTAGAPVVLFAEATTNDGNRILRFRSSHFESSRIALAVEGSPRAGLVQPLFIAYSRRVGMPVGRADRPLVAWYGDMTFFDHFWRFLMAGRIDCDIYCGAPIDVRLTENRKVLARRAEAAVRNLATQARWKAPRRARTEKSLFSKSPKSTKQKLSLGDPVVRPFDDA
jgi:lyso-ornithine lipid O-acyltransferase